MKLTPEEITQIAEQIKSKVDISHAAISLGMSRDTIYRLGKKHPEAQEALDYLTQPAKNKVLLSLPDDIHNDLERLANDLGVSKAGLARMLVKEGLESYLRVGGNF